MVNSVASINHKTNSTPSPTNQQAGQQANSTTRAAFKRSSSISSDTNNVSQQNTIERPVFSKSLTNKIALKIATARSNHHQQQHHSRTNSLNQNYNSNSFNFTSDTLILANNSTNLKAIIFYLLLKAF